MVTRSYSAPRQPPFLAGNAALRAAREQLGAARDAFQRAGRADVSGAIGSALEIVREVELSLLAGVEGPRSRVAADWFLD